MILESSLLGEPPDDEHTLAVVLVVSTTIKLN
jgi:hypothetical protein